MTTPGCHTGRMVALLEMVTAATGQGRPRQDRVLRRRRSSRRGTTCGILTNLACGDRRALRPSTPMTRALAISRSGTPCIAARGGRQRRHGWPRAAQGTHRRPCRPCRPQQSMEAAQRQAAVGKVHLWRNTVEAAQRQAAARWVVVPARRTASFPHRTMTGRHSSSSMTRTRRWTRHEPRH